MLKKMEGLAIEAVGHVTPSLCEVNVKAVLDVFADANDGNINPHVLEWNGKIVPIYSGLHSAPALVAAASFLSTTACSWAFSVIAEAFASACSLIVFTWSFA